MNEKAIAPFAGEGDLIDTFERSLSITVPNRLCTWSTMVVSDCKRNVIVTFTYKSQTCTVVSREGRM